MELSDLRTPESGRGGRITAHPSGLLFSKEAITMGQGPCDHCELTESGERGALEGCAC